MSINQKGKGSQSVAGTHHEVPLQIKGLARSGLRLAQLSTALLGLVLSGFAGVSQASSDYTLDSSHMEVGFNITHMTISKVKGRFNKTEGKFTFDEAKNELTGVDVKVDVASIDTNEKKRDEHLVGPEFFDVKTFPSMTFKSEKVEKVKGKPAKLVGILTIHGKSNKVTLDIADYKGPVTDPYGNQRLGFTASGKINRKDFGLTWNHTLDKGGLMVGDDVNINIDGEAIKVVAKGDKEKAKGGEKAGEKGADKEKEKAQKG